jgi:flavin reductase (DIM6/NTAB) family NADH-FMN oxidoreductase RutF
MMDASEFRRVLGHFPTGVTIVATRLPDGRPCGLTVNAFCSLSLDPPLVLVCIERNAETHACIEEAGYFAVSVLDAARGEFISRRFSAFGIDDKFGGVAHRDEVTGAPVVEASVAWVDCRLVEVHAGGDHSIFVGEVLAGGAVDGTPLVYYRGGYGRFQP